MDIQVKDISKIYGVGESRVTALHHANMQIRPGDFISIMGPSGSGKSTLLHIISGLDTPTSGQVLYGDTDIHHGSDRELSAFRRRRLTHLPHELSGGQQQRVAIARALIAKPDIIFADEPTGNLDSKSGCEVMRMLCDLRRQMNKTLVIITHDPRIAEMAERRFTIVDGTLSEVTGK